MICHGRWSSNHNFRIQIIVPHDVIDSSIFEGVVSIGSRDCDSSGVEGAYLIRTQVWLVRRRRA
jgi:hypothetical protein